MKGITVHISQLTRPADFWQSRGFVSPDVNPPCFSQCCARVSAELVAVEIERWQAKLADPEFRAFMLGVFQTTLAKYDEDQNGEDATREDFMALPADGQRQFHKCGVCGLIVDMRHLDDVLFS